METAGNSKKTAKPRGAPFKPGQSGNPKGRPKTTQEQKDALQCIRDLAPDAARTLSEILHSEETSPKDKLRAVGMILERTYGKPEATINVNDPQRESLDDLRRIVEDIKAGGSLAE